MSLTAAFIDLRSKLTPGGAVRASRRAAQARLVDAQRQLGQRLAGHVVRPLRGGEREVQLLVALGQAPLGAAQVTPASHALTGLARVGLGQ